MKKMLFLVCITTVILFLPYFLWGKIPFQSNYLVSFFAPWNTMKFVGWPQGIPFKPTGLDNLNLFYPYKQLSIELFKKGVIPLWNPYNFAGNVLAADFQSAIWYPLNFIYFVLPMVDAWSVMIIVQPILAGVFTYLFLKSLEMETPAAIFGSIAFAFANVMIVWMGDHLVFSHAMIWLSLALFTLEKFITSKKLRYWFLGIAALTTSLFAGFVQPFVYVWAVAFLYGIFRLFFAGKRYTVRTIIYVVLLFVFSAGVGAIQLIPTFEIFQLSPRGSTDVGYLYDQYLMPIRHLIAFLAPDYQGNPATYNFLGGGYHESVLSAGSIPFIFALLTLWSVRKKKIIAFFWLIVVVSVYLGFNLPFVRFIYAHTPILSTFLPSRIFFVTAFAMSILSGFGAAMLLAHDVTKRCIATAVACLIVLVIWGAFAPALSRHLFVPGGLLVAAIAVILLLQRRRAALVAALILLSLAGQIYFGYKYLSFNERQFVYPAHPVFTFLQNNAGSNRFWTYGKGYITANFATQYRVYSPDGTDALFPARLGELYASAKNGMWTPSERIDARIPPLMEGEYIDKNRYRLRLLSLLGVKYVTDYGDVAFPPALFRAVGNFDGWRIFEYTKAMPRVFVTNDFTVEEKPQNILDTIYAQPIDGKKLILETPPVLAIANTQATGSVQIASYDTNTVSISVSTDSNTLLFLSDTYMPGWRAYIDGSKVPVYRANYAFRAVAVPAGAKTVVFRYEPDSLKWGFIVSGASVVLLLVAGILFKL